MNVSHKILFGIVMGACPFGVVMAQELNENVSVEGVYKPEIIRQERLAAFPLRPEVVPSLPSLSYDEKGRLIDFGNTLTPMAATVWNAQRELIRNRGYVSLESGSYLNSNISAGYRFIDTDETTVGAWLQYNSTSLFSLGSRDNGDRRYRRRYDASAGVYGTHLFEDKGRLSVSARYGFDYFNYYGVAPEVVMDGGPGRHLGGQTYQAANEFNIKVGWDAQSSKSLLWRAAAEVNYLGFRDLLLPKNETSRLDYLSIPGQRETDLRLTGGFQMPWENGSRIGLDGAFDFLMYSGADRESVISTPAENYANLTLTPYYGFRRGLLNIRLGADVDLTFNAGTEGARYHLFHIAPDFRFDWRKDCVGFYLHVLGGSELQTLSMLRQRDYYMMPVLLNTRPVYSPVDAVLGATLGPVAGFTANFSVAYKISNHVPLGGWYTYWLEESHNPLSGKWDTTAQGGILSADNDMTIKGFSISLNLNYKLAEKFYIDAKGTYQNQNKGTGYFNGYDRPRWTLDCEMGWRPAKRFLIAAEYNLRGVRNVYYNIPAEQGGNIIIGDMKPTIGVYHLPNYENLGVKLQFDVTDAFSLWVRGDNLTCRTNWLQPGLKTEKFAVMGGLSLTF